MFKLIGIYLVVVALLQVSAEEEEVFVPVKYKTCKSAFEVLSVESTKCPLDDENRCIFTQDDTPKIRIGFKPNRDVEGLKTQVRARLGDKHSMFNLENDDACKGQNLTCPLKANQIYYYSQTVKIAREYPAIEVMVNWLLNEPITSDEKKAQYFNEEGDRIKSDLCVVFMTKVSEKE